MKFKEHQFIIFIGLFVVGLLMMYSGCRYEPVLIIPSIFVLAGSLAYGYFSYNKVKEESEERVEIPDGDTMKILTLRGAQQRIQEKEKYLRETISRKMKEAAEDGANSIEIEFVPENFYHVIHGEIARKGMTVTFSKYLERPSFEGQGILKIYWSR